MVILSMREFYVTINHKHLIYNIIYFIARIGYLGAQNFFGKLH
jgi:hypothetical protein